MKFQDDISNERMDTRLYGQAETNMLSNFFNVASIKIKEADGQDLLLP